MSPALAMRDVAVELREDGELAAPLGGGVVGAVGRGGVAVDDRCALVGPGRDRPRVDRARRDVRVVRGAPAQQRADVCTATGAADHVSTTASHSSSPSAARTASGSSRSACARLGAVDRGAADATGHGRDVVAAGQGGLDERAADVVGASEHEQSHGHDPRRRTCRRAKDPSLST